MADITLARALKYKNRVAQRLREVARIIQTRNTTLVGNDAEHNTHESLKDYERLMTHLVDLKDRIAKATSPVLRTIFTMEELKAKIEMLRGVSTQHGQAASGWREDRPVAYTSQIREKEVTELVTGIEHDLDTLQEKLDTHNAITRISVDMIV